MPAKGRKRALKPALESKGKNKKANISSEGKKNEPYELFIQNLDSQVNVKCDKIREEANEKMMALRTKFSVLKMKIPKMIREMPLRDYLIEFEENPKTILFEGIKKVDDDEPETAVKGTRGEVDFTPSRPFGQLSINTPSTVARLPRQGETVMSVNGSPILTCGDDRMSAVFALEQNISVIAKNEVPWSETGRAEALGKLRDLQKQIGSLLNELQ